MVARAPRIDPVPYPSSASRSLSSSSGSGGERGKSPPRLYQAITAHPKLRPLPCGITQAAVAQFLVDAAEMDTWDGQAVQIYTV